MVCGLSSIELNVADLGMKGTETAALGYRAAWLPKHSLPTRLSPISG